MSPHDAERMTTRYQLLFVAVERAINEADPIGLLELGAPSSEYAGEIGTLGGHPKPAINRHLKTGN